MNKRGWIHILEATIAVMIVAGVMVTVYSDQSSRADFAISDFAYSLQSEILDSITINRDLRMDILRVVVDSPGDPYYDRLDSIVAAEIPTSFGHLLRVCNLGDPDNACKMPPIIFRATLDKNIFVEETVVSSELGDGTNFLYSPKKLRLFFWEGDADFAEGECVDQCQRGGVTCSLGSPSGIVTMTCEDVNGDGCLERSTVKDECGAGYICDRDSVTCEAEGCVRTCSEYTYCSGSGANQGVNSADGVDVYRHVCNDDASGCLTVGSEELDEPCGGRGCVSDGSGQAACGDDSSSCDECDSEGVTRSCSNDGRSSLVETCEYGSSGCLEKSVDTISCRSGLCYGGVCEQPGA